MVTRFEDNVAARHDDLLPAHDRYEDAVSRPGCLRHSLAGQHGARTDLRFEQTAGGADRVHLPDVCGQRSSVCRNHVARGQDAGQAVIGDDRHPRLMAVGEDSEDIVEGVVRGDEGSVQGAIADFPRLVGGDERQEIDAAA